MATLKSNKRQRRYTGGALLFSGRPNPTWPIPRPQAQQLKKVWKSLRVTTESPPSAPALGYQGCFLREATTQEWFAYRGVVTLRAANSLEQKKKDEDRVFEKLLLSTAPQGEIPTAFLDSDLR